MNHKHMKIYHFIVIFFISLLNFSVRAQDASPSPYSFFGLGDTAFQGTVENISMGGINILSDSLHYSINSPASLSRLKFINFNMGMNNRFIHAETPAEQEWMSAHNISYFALAIPFGKKYAIGLGLLPVNSSGYKIYSKNDLGTYTFDGEGGNNRIFLAGSYRLTGDFSVGIEYQYYFGFLKRENIWIPNNVITYTKENNLLDFSGSTFKFSALYKYPMADNKYININANYRLATSLKAEYKHISRLFTIVGGTEEVAETLQNDTQTGNLHMPYSIDFGTGFGKKNKWFIGANVNYTSLKDYKNIFYDPDYVQYNDAQSFRIGGMFVPQYNSVTKYWKRITYRYGGYYKNTGMNLYNEDIKDFGITFGLGLPAIRGISNMNIGVELGQRGKITEHLIKENYINLHIGISLNDTWFIKRKIN